MCSWNTYALVGYKPPGELCMAPIIKSMHLFENQFKVDVKAIGHSKLLVWQLELEDKTKRVKTRIGSKENAEKERPPVIRKYIFALHDKEGLLFTDKVLIKKLQSIMKEALYCDGFERLPLHFGNPSNLLMMYVQRKDHNSGILELQYQDRMLESLEQLKNGNPLSSTVGELADKDKEVHLQIGSAPKQIPQIKSVEVTVKNMAIKSKGIKRKQFRMGEMRFAVSAPSVFHLYLSLKEQDIIKEIPPWLKKMRTSGKTYSDVHYN